MLKPIDNTLNIWYNIAILKKGMIVMTIEEVFNKQKAILLELGFPINPNAELIIFNSVYSVKHFFWKKYFFLFST